MRGLAIVGAVLGTLLIAAIVVVSAYAIKYYTADTRGRIEANERIKSGANRIVQYDHFFNLCASVQTNEETIRQLQAQLDETTDEDTRQWLTTTIIGVRSERARRINEYNADASKSYTSAQFLDSDLPDRLSIAQEETRCAAPAY